MSKQVESLLGEVIFHPTPDMRETKSKMLIALEDNPILLRDKITCANAVHLTDDDRINKWWNLPGFKEWFTNKDEFRERADAASHRALAVLIDILDDPEARASAKVAAAKLIFAASRKLDSSSSEEKYLDAVIQKMNEEQLKQYLEKNLKGYLKEST